MLWGSQQAQAKKINSYEILSKNVFVSISRVRSRLKVCYGRIGSGLDTTGVPR